MIKIQIKDKKALQSSYLKIIQTLVIKELEKLKLSLSHLLDANTIQDEDINDAMNNTFAIVNMMRTPKKEKKYFEESVYLNGVKNWQRGAKKIKPINLSKVESLIDDLLDTKKNVLEKLLIGQAEKLKKFNDDLLLKYGINSNLELDVIKLAFKYTGTTLGKKIRDFFNTEKLTLYCPYCNQNLATHSANPITGKSADGRHLDHFFDQDKNPLLALSLFNLVPSDFSCNSVNKGTIGFSDEFHLNPYTSGFKRDMIFSPIFDLLDEDIKEIELIMKAPRKSLKYRQLVGDYDDLNMSSIHGNLNVFQIHTKYNREDVIEEANRIFSLLKRDAQNKKSLEDILQGTGMIDSHKNFAQYFYEKTGTLFHENRFGERAYSKLYRDILDFIYEKYPTEFNPEVKKIIEESYLPGKGRE